MWRWRRRVSVVQISGAFRPRVSLVANELQTQAGAHRAADLLELYNSAQP
jgi:hypothetical protein